MSILSTSLAADRTPKPLSTEEIAERITSKCICMRSRELMRLVTKAYDHQLRRLGISASQLTLLTKIAMQDGIGAVQITQDINIEKSSLARNLKRLLDGGFLTRGPRAGRNVQHLHLTAQGHATIQAAHPLWEEVQMRAIAAMGTGSPVSLDVMITGAEKICT